MMIRGKRRFLVGLFCAIFLINGFVLGDAQGGRRRKEKAVNQKAVEESRPGYVSALLMEADTGRVLFE